MRILFFRFEIPQAPTHKTFSRDFPDSRNIYILHQFIENFKSKHLGFPKHLIQSSPENYTSVCSRTHNSIKQDIQDCTFGTVAIFWSPNCSVRRSRVNKNFSTNAVNVQNFRRLSMCTPRRKDQMSPFETALRWSHRF